MRKKLTFEEFKTEAKRRFEVEGLKTNHTNPIAYLYSLDWPIPKEPPYDAYTLSEMNLNFNQKSCYGRTVRATVLWEQLFPKHKFYAAIICQDFLRDILMDGITKKEWADITYLQEILQYEEDHIALIDSYQIQFDPNLKDIALNFPQKIDPWFLKHTKVVCEPIWDSLYCSYLSAFALFHQDKDYDLYQSTLKEAHQAYPNSSLINGNLIHALYAEEDTEGAIEFAKKVIKVRKDAKILHILWFLVDEGKKNYYRDLIINEYSIEMFDYLVSSFESRIKHNIDIILDKLKNDNT